MGPIKLVGVNFWSEHIWYCQSKKPNSAVNIKGESKGQWASRILSAAARPPLPPARSSLSTLLLLSGRMHILAAAVAAFATTTLLRTLMQVSKAFISPLLLWKKGNNSVKT